MSRLIAELLGSDRRDLDKIISRLEHVTLQPGVDTRLTAEIITQTREKSRAFGYDPKNATARELYYGLLAKTEENDAILRNRLGIKNTDKTQVVPKKIATQAEKLLKKEKLLAMQPVAVKRVLKAVPPKKTMKLLKFRSLDSVLKREDPLVLYALARKIEDKSWHTQINARLKRLQARDAIEQSVKVICLPSSWVDKLKKQPFENVVQPVAEIGSVLILPTVPVTQKGSVLLTMALILQAGQRLAVESLPYRTKALSIGVEKLIPDIATGFVEEFEPVHGMQPSWHAVYRLLAEQGKQHLPDFDLILGDLQWESTESKLASLTPEMDIWVNSHYLAFPHQPLPLSMHLIDITASLVLERKFGEHIVSHMRSSLWNELQLRYIKQESLERAIIDQLSYAQGIML